MFCENDLKVREQVFIFNYKHLDKNGYPVLHEKTHHYTLTNDTSGLKF